MATKADASPGQSSITARHHVTLILMMLVCALSYVDRQVFTLFQDDIKRDLGIGDAQLRLLTGMSFALFYSAVAFPVARYADRGDRRLVISLSVIVWSIATAFCGMAQSFWTMMLARIGLASGEAGAGPAANSLLTEIFPPQRRVMVISLLLAANAVGISGGLVLGGWLSRWFDWREVFLIVGFPGIILGAAVWLFSLEPRRRSRGQAGVEPEASLSIREVLRTMFGNPSIRWAMLLLSTVPVIGFALILWGPSFFLRVHGMDKGEVGFWLGGAMLAGLVLGNIFAGWVGDRFGAANPRFNGWFSGIGLLAAFPFALWFALSSSPYVALCCFIIVKFAMSIHLPPLMALCFAQVPVRMRAMMSATITMFIGIAGTGIGGTLAGVLSQSFEPQWGELSLRPAMATISSFLLVGGVAAIMAGRTARPLPENIGRSTAAEQERSE
jgi:MFS family permease